MDSKKDYQAPVLQTYGGIEHLTEDASKAKTVGYHDEAWVDNQHGGSKLEK